MTIDEITGGTINYHKSEFARYILIGTLTIVIVYLLYLLYRNVEHSREIYNQQQVLKHFSNLHGETLDDTAKNVIHYGEIINNPRAIDHYRLGTTYLVNAHNPRQAHDHFRLALDQVIDQKVDTREALFIIDFSSPSIRNIKINDFNTPFVLLFSSIINLA